MRVNKADNLEYLQGWWQEIHGHNLNPRCLPPNKFYIIQDDEPVAYFGMHRMECCVCYLGFPTISNKIRRKERKRVFKVMCDCAKAWASKNGLEVVFISIQGESAAKNLMANGFRYGDEEKGAASAKHLFMRV